ncbi:hypothetical protein GCM10010466_29430 [Planomonospora alba]|uniref:Uncharacterized protein n=1 Tax=Planomonospora alba TaxID=161354 RepID=A0ABP6N520_9ACTN
MAGSYHWKIDQGSTVRKVVRWLKNDSPVDLTGWSARLEIRDRHGGTLLHRMTSGDSSIGLAADGTISLHIPAATSTAWKWLVGVYDLELITPEGEPVRLLEGPVTLSPEVTTGA